MGASTNQQQQSQTTNTLDPWVKGLISTNVAQAETAADTPYTPFTGESIAPFTSTQIQGQNYLTNLANDPSASGGNTLDAATAAAKASAGYTPQQITAPTATSTGYAPTSYNASLLDPSSIAAFENPYTQQVVDTTNAAANQSLLQEENQNNANATKAGAWRGSAAAVQNAVSTGLSNTALDTTDAGLYSAGYTQAAGLAGSNVDRENAALAANAAAANSASAFGAGAANTADLANAGYNLTAQEQNQQAGLTANQQQQAASSLLGNLSAQELAQNTARGNLLTGVGATQQAQGQAQDTFNYNQYLAQVAYPAQQQAIRNAALGMVPAVQSSSSSGTSNTQTDPGILGDISTGLTDASKIGQLVTISDERIKKDVRTVGFDRHGRRWVDYRHTWEGPNAPKTRGLIAQDTLRTDPQAVKRLPGHGGLLGVDYGKLAA